MREKREKYFFIANGAASDNVEMEGKMNKKCRIVMMGGGSVNWSPKLINDFMLTKGLEEAEYVIFDTDDKIGEKMAALGNYLSHKRGLSCTFYYTYDQKSAFLNADYVIITISTGGLDAMAHDLEIPEEYGIYQTVGDTVGPGGWARGLRNIPVFAETAMNIQKYAPGAVVLNYTNPMAALTKVFYKVSHLQTVGLCHGLFEVYALLMKLFGLESEEQIKVRFGGVNHFFWITELRINGENGYDLLRKKIGHRSFADIVSEKNEDEPGLQSNLQVCSELFSHYGYLPYTGDRHISEFLPSYLTFNKKNLAHYQLERTSIGNRREKRQKGIEKLDAYLQGTAKLPNERSRETAANIIAAKEKGSEFIDVVNLPNVGQINNLPLSSVVETLGVVNNAGFTPLTVGDLPVQILNLILPHVYNQNLIVEAGLEGDLEKALFALYNDPLCSHMRLPDIKEMGIRLLNAHRDYVPQFF